MEALINERAQLERDIPVKIVLDLRTQAEDIVDHYFRAPGVQIINGRQVQGVSAPLRSRTIYSRRR